MSETKDYLLSLGATETALLSIAEDMERDNLAVIVCPFSSITDINGNNTVSVTIGTYVLNFSLRRRFVDGKWYIQEEGTVDGNNYIRTSVVSLLSFKHFADKFTYMLVSPYAYLEEMTDEYALALLQNMSFIVKY